MDFWAGYIAGILVGYYILPATLRWLDRVHKQIDKERHA